MGGADFLVLTTGAVNMGLVRYIDIDLTPGDGPMVCLNYPQKVEHWFSKSDAIIILKWLKDHAGRYPHLSLDLDAASWQGRELDG